MHLGRKPEIGQVLMPSDATVNKLTPILPILSGLPAMRSKNTVPLLGIVDGSVTTLVGVQFREETGIVKTRIEIVPMKIASSPEILFVDIPTCKM